MQDTLRNRVGRLISGSIHVLFRAMQDQAPEKIMNKAIGEINATIGEIRAELGEAIASRHLANTQLLEAKRNQEKQHGHAGGNHQLPVSSTEAQIMQLQRAIYAAEDKEAELEGYMRALQAKRRELQNEFGQLRCIHPSNVEQEVRNKRLKERLAALKTGSRESHKG